MLLIIWLYLHWNFDPLLTTFYIIQLKLFVFPKFLNTFCVFFSFFTFGPLQHRRRQKKDNFISTRPTSEIIDQYSELEEFHAECRRIPNDLQNAVSFKTFQILPIQVHFLAFNTLEFRHNLFQQVCTFYFRPAHSVAPRLVPLWKHKGAPLDFVPQITQP